MGDLTGRHTVLGASKEEIERKMRDHYPDAAVILARRDEDGGPARSRTTNKEVEP